MKEPGYISAAVHKLDTGEHQPIRTPPYRLCPAWRQQVKTLLQGGTIEPCTGPWSSPMVPIKKPDGSLRLCVDFRRINAVTIPDPFCMPLINHILDNMGDCLYLDLAKVFLSGSHPTRRQGQNCILYTIRKIQVSRMPF